MTILTMPDDRLRQASAPIETLDSEVTDLADHLMQLSYQYDGSGLAAVQVGVLWRLLVVTMPEREYAMVNPEIVEQSEDHITEREGCLSIPGVSANVPRPRFVRVEGTNPYTGESQDIRAYQTEARVLIHELDHLDGVLFIDHLSRNKRMRLMRGYNARFQ